MPDDKKKTVEGEKTIYPTPLILKSEGGAAVFHVTPGAIGHGHLSEGFVATDPGAGTGSGVPSGPSTPAPEPQHYFAYCEADHPLDMPGVDASGHWNSGWFDLCRQAFDAALLHEDGRAQVYALQDNIGLGPLGGC